MAEFKETVISGSFPLSETTEYSYVRILPGAEVLPPEGKLVTLTANGKNVPIAPGVYEGKIVFTITDRIPLGTYPFRAGVCVTDGKYVPEMSIAAAVSGTVSDTAAESVTFRSSEENVNGFYIAGTSEYSISDTKLSLIGNGGNDFVGFGAGIFAGDTSKVTIERSTIETDGAARGTIYLCGEADLTINDSSIESHNGILPADYIDTVTPGVMRAVPWMLGLSGNCRAFNLAESATAHFNRCTMKAEGWGVMSTDGVRKGRLYMKDSAIEITGRSGYGAFSINDCLVSFDSCTVKVPDIGLIVANGKASGEFTGNTRVDSDRFGVMIFRNTMGRVDVGPGVEFHTGESVFLIKGCTPEIHVDSAVLESRNGTILTVMDTDDPNDTGAYYSDPTEEDVPIPGRDLTSGTPGEDVVVTLSHVDLSGDFYNATTNRKAVTGILDPDAPKAPAEPLYSGGPGSHQGGAGGAKGPGGPAGGPGGPAGAPGGPSGAPGGGGKPGEMPEFFKKLMGLDKPPVKNLSIEIEDSTLRGRVTSGNAKHRVPKVTKYNREEIGEVVVTPAPSINNGVSLRLINTQWTVTDVCYLDSLTVTSGSSVINEAGTAASITVDGKPVTFTDDISFQGKIVIRP